MKSLNSIILATIIALLTFHHSVYSESVSINLIKEGTVSGVEADGRLYLDAAIDEYMNIHLLWYSIRINHTSSKPEIDGPYYMKGTELGHRWTSPVNLADDVSDPAVYGLKEYPRIIAAGDTVGVYWTLNELNYKLSTDSGASWGPDVRSLDGVIGTKFCLKYDKGILYIAYSNRFGTYFSQSDNFGESWAEPIEIGPPLNIVGERSTTHMAISQNDIYVVGEAADQNRGDFTFSPCFYFMHGTDFGNRWDEPKLVDLSIYDNQIISKSSAVNLRIWQLKNKLLVSFIDNGLFYLKSDNEGSTWFAPQTTPAMPEVRQYDICSLGDESAIAFWVDYRNEIINQWDKKTPIELSATDQDPRLGNNDLFYSIIDDQGMSSAVQLTETGSYAGFLHDALFCDYKDPYIFVIWGGKAKISGSPFNEKEKSQIFFKIFKVDK